MFAILFLIVVSATSAGVAVAGGDDNPLCGVELSKPLLKAVTHSPPNFVSVHRPYLVVSTLMNHCDQEVPFVALFEVRDVDGITRSLDYDADTLEPDRLSEPVHTWWPEEPGDYELRAFVISNFTNPEILTGVISNQVEILA